MVCLGLKPGVAGWKAQMNPLTYGGSPLKNMPRFFSGLKYIKNTFFTVHNYFFAKQLIQIQKRDTKSANTNHYILLTNVSIKRCIRPGSHHILLGGGGEGKSSNHTSTLQTIASVIQAISVQ